MKIIRFVFPLFVVLLMACQKNDTGSLIKDYAAYVNPFIGTSKMGHVFPGATAPFGMVQLSPQTNFVPMFHPNGSYNAKTYEYCAGYQYADTIILGFAHTNFSGTGHSDLGDFLVMPAIGELVLDPLQNEDGSKGFYSTISKESENASPGYYSVQLQDYNIKAELTATERVGFHRYHFPESEKAHIILDMVYNVYHHDDKNVWAFIRVENDTLVTGYRQTHGWARTRTVYFAMSFSKPFKSYGHRKYDRETYKGFYRRFNQEENFPEMAGRNLRAYFNFDTGPDEAVMIKMAISGVSTHGALNNLKTEVPHWDFDRTHRETRQKWNNELSKIEAETLTEDQKVVFYTALYHSFLSPVLFEDVDGSYRGLDQNIHQSDGFTNYTIFSLWDTYRALHPLFNIIQPAKNNDMIKSMLAHYDQSVHKMLPIWSHYANENWCMIGYHASAVIADAMVKNPGGFDHKHALKAAVSTANVPYFDGLGYYLQYGYVPDDKSHSSVSKTLELAYNDWCIAQIARLNGDKTTEAEFLRRSMNFRHVYDSVSGFMRPRLSDGRFRADFDPLDTYGQGFIEGNAWNYGLYVPHQVEKMLDMMGGPKWLSAHLDQLFSMELDDKYIEKHEDITRDGIIGSYVHGNEPGHHIPYLYNWSDKPYKTQERVRMIMETMYGASVDGLCGNDDAGQMSAWYIFSSLGFYPVKPGSPYYSIGSPLVKKAIVHLENGKKLTINTENQSAENVYVAEVLLNGKPVHGWVLTHHDLAKGGELLFKMRPAPVD